MNEKEASAIIRDLREQVAWMQQVLLELPMSYGKVLELHWKWIRQKEGGVQLNLSNMMLSGVLMRETVLKKADFSGATMFQANLRDVNLREADLRDTDLEDAIFRRTDLARAKIIDDVDDRKKAPTSARSKTKKVQGSVPKKRHSKMAVEKNE